MSPRARGEAEYMLSFYSLVFPPFLELSGGGGIPQILLFSGWGTCLSAQFLAYVALLAPLRHPAASSSGFRWGCPGPTSNRLHGYPPAKGCGGPGWGGAAGAQFCQSQSSTLVLVPSCHAQKAGSCQPPVADTRKDAFSNQPRDKIRQQILHCNLTTEINSKWVGLNGSVNSVFHFNVTLNRRLTPYSGSKVIRL